MAFNALVGNTDDHTLNTGLLFDGTAWGLSPAFDITPNMVSPPKIMKDGPSLSMATGVDGHSGASVARLTEAAQWLGLDRDDANQWLHDTARLVAEHWEPMLRAAAAPIMQDAARMDRLVDDVRPAFAYADWLAASVVAPAKPLNLS